MVELDRNSFWLDLREFEARAAEGTTEALTTALALYRDELMTGLYLDHCPEFEVWVVSERERWQQRVVALLERLTNHHTSRDEWDQALPYAARSLELVPWREEAHRELMRLLARTGQRSAALQQFETARRVLAEELNVEPSAETRALHVQIRAEEVAPPFTPPHNLPIQLTTFFGRETELARIAARLNNPECRLLTLVGPGGIGKTRLALEAAGQLLSSFRDGVYFVPLTSIAAGQSDFIVPAIANALSITFAGATDPKKQLLEFLRTKSVLLLLDNFEHLLDGAAFMVEILQHAPNVKILDTSREPLNVKAEWVTRVEGLSYPSTEQHASEELLHFGAVKLFIERAQRVDERFAWNVESAPHVIRLAQIVEGMPLALELAAARIRTATLNEIRGQVEKHFDVLATTMRDEEARHRSLRAVVDWSYGLLSPAEQALFRQLSVFAGGWTEQAILYLATEVAVESEEIVALLSRLQSKSLIREELGSQRYSMLEPIRQYAQEKLEEAAEAAQTRVQHLEYFVNFAEEAEKHFQHADQLDWLERIGKELDNSRAAMSWALLSRQILLGLRLARVWFGVVNARGQQFNEVSVWFDQLLPHIDGLPRSGALGHALLVAGYIAHRRGDIEAKTFYHEHARSIALQIRDQALLARYYATAGTIAGFRKDFEVGIAFRLQGLAIAEQLNDLELQYLSYSALVQLCIQRDDLTATRCYCERALQIAERLGDRLEMAEQMSKLATLTYYSGDLGGASVLASNVLTLAREFDNPALMASAFSDLGDIALTHGDLDAAWHNQGESCKLVLKWHDEVASCFFLESWARLAAFEKQYSQAATLLGAAEIQRETTVTPVTSIAQKEIERTVQQIRTYMDLNTFEVAWKKGRALTLHESLVYALDFFGDHAPSRFA